MADNVINLSDSGCLIDYEEVKLFKEADDTAIENEALDINYCVRILEAMEDSVEAQSIKNRFGLDENGCLIDYPLSIRNQFTMTDDGYVNDAFSLLIMLSLTDSNISISETLSLFNSLGIIESGTLGEILGIMNRFGLDDISSGITNVYPIHNFLGTSESGTILEYLDVVIGALMNDSSSSEELIELFMRIMLLESALGDDNIALTVYTLLSDYGSASEKIRQELLKIIGSLIFIKQKNIKLEFTDENAEIEFTNERTFDVER